MLRGLRDQVGVQLMSHFAAVQCARRLVLAHFARKSGRFAPADVRRIADDQIKISPLLACFPAIRPRPHISSDEQIAFKETNTIGDAVARGIAPCYLESG